MISCGNENRTSLIPPMIAFALESGIIDTSPDLCGEDRNRSTLITSGFTSSGILTDTSRTVYYKVNEEANVAHTIKLQTLSTNCDSIAIRFDSCKYNRRNGNLQLQCNFPSDTAIGSSGWNGLVRQISGIRDVECLVKTISLSIIELSNNAKTTQGGCQWSFQYNKN